MKYEQYKENMGGNDHQPGVSKLVAVNFEFFPNTILVRGANWTLVDNWRSLTNSLHLIFTSSRSWGYKAVRDWTSVIKALPSHYHYHTSSHLMFPDSTSTTWHHPWTVPQRRHRPCFIPSVGNGMTGMGNHTLLTQTKRSAPTATRGNKYPSPCSCSFLLALFPSLQPAWNAPALLGHVLALRGRHQTHHSAKRVQKGQHPQAALGTSERTRAQNPSPKKQRCQSSPPGACRKQEQLWSLQQWPPFAPWGDSAGCEVPPAPPSSSEGTQAGQQGRVPAVPAPGWPWHLKDSRKSSILLLLHIVFQSNHETPEHRGERDGWSRLLFPKSCGSQPKAGKHGADGVLARPLLSLH